jgi:hypothetical protein
MRLRELVASLSRNQGRLVALEAENAIIREAKGETVEMPLLRRRVDELGASLGEMMKVHRVEYLRARELEEARLEALECMGLVEVGMAVRLLRARKALSKVPGCNTCRDDLKAKAEREGIPLVGRFECAVCKRVEQVER